MERVNLLPDEVRFTFVERFLRMVDRHFLRVLASAVGGLIVLGVAISLRETILFHRTEDQLKSLEKEVNLLEIESQNKTSFLKQLEQVEQDLLRQKKLLEGKLSYLRAVEGEPRVWAVVLKDLRQNVPRGIWLAEFETGQGNALRVVGGALDEEMVTRFMHNLKQSPHFSNVVFTYTEKDRVGDITIVRFEINCRARS